MGSKIIHFEIPANDVEKMSNFYSDLFGWKFAKQSMPGMDYWLIETTGQGMEHLGGGMYAKQGETDKPRFYVQVDEIDSHTERFKQAGGTVVMEKQEVPGLGYSVIGVDPEGNMLGLFQPIQQQAPRKRSSSSRKSSASRKSSKKGASASSKRKK